MGKAYYLTKLIERTPLNSVCAKDLDNMIGGYTPSHSPFDDPRFAIGIKYTTTLSASKYTHTQVLRFEFY